MESLVNYYSDDDQESDSPRFPMGCSKADFERRAQEAEDNYDNVGMDLSDEESNNNYSPSRPSSHENPPPNRQKSNEHSRPFSNLTQKERSRSPEQSSRRQDERNKEYSRRTSKDGGYSKSKYSNSDLKESKSDGQSKLRDRSKRSGSREYDPYSRSSKDHEDKRKEFKKRSTSKERDSRRSSKEDQKQRSRSKERDNRSHRRSNSKDKSKCNDRSDTNKSDRRDRSERLRSPLHRDRKRSRSRDRKRSNSRDRNNRRSRSPVKERRRSRSPKYPEHRFKSKYDRTTNKLAVLEKLGIEIKTPDCQFVTPQMLLQKTMSDKVEEVKNATGIELPKYYNPAVMNPSRYAEQIQKRKLLWGNKSKLPETQVAEQSNIQPTLVGGSIPKIWQTTKFNHDTDGKVASKFKRLMGIKETSAEGNKEVVTNETLKKQEEMFHSMEAQYEVARAATHTMRGVGLGFGAFTGNFQR